jgi:steroid 5-alpha reductase family enzyme
VAFFIITWTFLGFMVSRLLQRNDIADLMWGTGITTLTLAIGLLTGTVPLNPTHWLTMTLVAVWGLRLTLYLAARNLPEPEDTRYAEWRKEWGPREPLIALARVFLLQTVLAVLVGAAAWAKLVNRSADTMPSAWDGITLGFALIGLSFEILADHQLMNYRSSRKASGQSGHGLLARGLWSCSRHPNYFGETVFWWGIALTGIHAGDWRMALGSIGGAALITFLLLRVSGITLTDRGMKSRRPEPEYRKYLEETPAFFPLPRFLRNRKKLNQS